MAEQSKIHAFEDVSKHNVAKDCWLIISGKGFMFETSPGCPSIVNAIVNEDNLNEIDFSVYLSSYGEPHLLLYLSLGAIGLEVYDVTPFMDDHPGGDEVLLAATGKDATNDFEDVGHSDSARELMSKYYIGEVDSSTIPAKRSYVAPQQAPYNPDKTTDFVIKILQFLVPLLILGLAFVVRHYTKTE
ncbi:hypothetical protein Taro_018936 [Colocasia esculenta]|uniref:Cytochrome b5 heme-binding domain-containing protein n=1 Tax=Colocasia esculenta TaxID=4460 RepID=A0A843V3Z9_COLES|nr:hypothetical protein [Colocasia esculenta]